MNDIALRGMAGKNIRFFAVDSTTTAKTAFDMHELSTTCGVIMGRMLTAGLLMGQELKNFNDSVTLKINADGPVGTVIVIANKKGQTKGYIANPKTELALDENTKSFKVAQALGNGFITVIKDIGGKKPYNGQVKLIKGEIAEDLTYYYAKSEQVPTAINLGVLIADDGSIARAGGFMVQLLPNTDEETIEKLEKAIYALPNVSDLLDMGYSIEHIVCNMLLKEFECKITEKHTVGYFCDCSKDKFERGLKMLGKEEINEMIDEDKTITTECHFCKTTYDFTIEDLVKIAKEAK